MDIACFDRDISALRHGLLGVENEIVDDLGYLSSVEMTQPEIVLDIKVRSCVGAAQGELDGFCDEREERFNFSNRRAALSKSQKLLGQSFGSGKSIKCQG